MNKEIKFFLGSKTYNGFVEFFDELNDPQPGNKLFILKGGAGTGKSTMMRRIGEKYKSEGLEVEYIPCASDPTSLDAVVVPAKRFAVLDGTPPHVMEPTYPGVYETLVPLGEAWDEKQLSKGLSSVLPVFIEIDDCHKAASAYVKSAANLYKSVKAKAKMYNNMKAIDQFASQILFQVEKDKGEMKTRLLSAVSVGKVEFLHTTLENMCDKIYAIQDEYGAAKTTALKLIAEKAKLKGVECIVCPCSIMGDDTIDHIIFPQSKIAITSASKYQKFDSPKIEVVEGLCAEMAVEHKTVMDSMLADAYAFVDKACSWVEQAKIKHDDLEAYYRAAMDFTKVDDFYKEIIKKIEN